MSGLIITLVIGLVVGYYLGFFTVKSQLAKLLKDELIDALHNGEIKDSDEAYKLLKELNSI